MSSKKITNIALLTAVVVLLQSLSSLGLLKIGQFSLALSFIPVMIGVICFGFWTGLFLGFIFSTVVLIFGLTSLDGGFTFLLFQYKPVLTVFLIYLKGCLAPVASYFVYKGISNKSEKWGTYIACPVCPMVNTGIFCVMMLCCYRGFLVNLFGSDNAVKIVFITLVGWNFVIEFAINLVIAPAVYRLKILYDKLFGRNASSNN